MKRSILVLMIFLLSCTSAFAQVESIVQGATGPGGRVTGEFNYVATGTDKDVAYETLARSDYYLSGAFPKVLIYKAGAGAYQSETLVEMTGGYMSMLEKVGSSKSSRGIPNRRRGSKEKTNLLFA